MQCTAFIPSRMGSKRIPRKNIRLFQGVPAICHVVRRLSESGLVREIFVSTDEKTILEDALDAGGVANFATILGRERELSTDHVTSLEVLQNWLTIADIPPSDLVLLTYPTSFFLSVDQIESALSLISRDSSQFVATVQEEDSSDRHLRITARGNVEFLHSEYANTRTQDTTRVFKDAAQLYLATARNWLIGSPFLSPTVPITMNKNSSIDVDTEEDWRLAELIYTKGC